MNMLIERIDTWEGFESLHADWDRLYDGDPQATVFQSWEWLAQPLRRHENWLILAARPGKGQPPVALLPLRIDVRWSEQRQRYVNDLFMIGTYSWADYNNLLCAPEHQAAAVPAIAKALRTMQWTSLHLRHFSADEERSRLFLDAFEGGSHRVGVDQDANRNGDVNNNVCPVAPLPDSFERYLSDELSSNTRQKLRRLLRQLDQDPELRITLATSDTFERDADILMSFWRQSWKDRKGAKLDHLSNRYREILTDAGVGGFLFMPMLWRGDRPLGGLGNFVDERKRTMLYFIAGRDETCNDPQPGLLLHAWAIRWAIDQRLTAYDFLRGNEAFKYSFGGKDRAIANHIVRRTAPLDPAAPLDRRSHAELLGLIEQAQRAEEAQKAEIGYKQLLFADRRNVAALSGLCSLLHEAGRFDEACYVASDRLEMQPEEPSALRQLGRALLGAGRFAEARDVLMKAVRLEPTISGRHYLARAFVALNLQEKAFEQWGEIIRLKPRGDRERKQQREAKAALADASRSEDATAAN